jgi:starch phosphorylase
VPLEGQSSSVPALREAILHKLAYAVGKDPRHARTHDWYMATALAVRDRIVDRWMTTTRRVYASGERRVYYLSVEFLIGRLLDDNLSNLGLLETARTALAGLGVAFEEVRECEPDAALGNGGLGRLAACFVESMATRGVAGFGYGIRYDHGLFRQLIRDGRQIELPEDWLSFGNPWEFERPEVAYPIGFGGTVEAPEGPAGRCRWLPGRTVMGIAYDTPIVGWRGQSINTLRLWSARPAEPMRLDMFNRGEHLDAFAEQLAAQAISRVLYPDDSTARGLELRLQQEYFFTSASLQDLLRRHLSQFGELRSLPEKAVIQLNDTHPALAVPELVRLLVDQHGLAFDDAFALARATIRYTNHTLLPEALESWPAALLGRLLPRHLQIVFEINARHLAAARARPDCDDQLLRAVSLIDERDGQRVRMGHLAFVGSTVVNGVSRLHGRLVAETLFRDLDRVLPGRITSVTNGVTLRRWVEQCNPGLGALLEEALGAGWQADGERLARLRPLAEDAAFRERFARLRRDAKERLARRVASEQGVRLDPDALFDVHVKRIHEYKRQLLNALETIALWQAMRADPAGDWPRRVKIFAGKAAASYHRAKLIIQLICDLAEAIRADPLVDGRLEVVFLPNYNVSLAELVMPAADLSEQISTAGMEASGTGNMKLALNGALTIGTLDGATIEIAERVGAEHLFLFGLSAEEVEARRAQGLDMTPELAETPRLQAALEALLEGALSPSEPHRYRPIVEAVRHHDWFMLCPDFKGYWARQREVEALWREPRAWWRTAVLNVAGSGWFSVDRAIGEYQERIWSGSPAGRRGPGAAPA